MRAGRRQVCLCNGHIHECRMAGKQAKETLEPDGDSPLEKRLRVVEEESSRKEQKTYRLERMLDEAARFLPEMEREDRALQEQLQSDRGNDLNLEMDDDAEEEHIKMVIDCGVFDVLRLEAAGDDDDEWKQLRASLDAQLDRLSDEDLVKLFELTKGNVQLTDGDADSGSSDMSDCSQSSTSDSEETSMSSDKAIDSQPQASGREEPGRDGQCTSIEEESQNKAEANKKKDD